MKPRIFLIGYRGTGKTSVAKLLAAKLGWTAIDADVVLEERAGKTIRQIFADDGEPAFRDLESAILADLAQREHVVISTGGGVVLRHENRERLKTGLTIWLMSDAESIWRRLQVDPTTSERRPNLTQGGLEEIVEMLAKREPLYRECADWSIDGTHLNSAQLADRIDEWLKEQTP
jgi:shikimate kinase